MDSLRVVVEGRETPKNAPRLWLADPGSGPPIAEEAAKIKKKVPDTTVSRTYLLFGG